MGSKKKCTFSKLGDRKIPRFKKGKKCLSAQQRYDKLKEWKGGW